MNPTYYWKISPLSVDIERLRVEKNRFLMLKEPKFALLQSDLEVSSLAPVTCDHSEFRRFRTPPVTRDRRIDWISTML